MILFLFFGINQRMSQFPQKSFEKLTFPRISPKSIMDTEKMSGIPPPCGARFSPIFPAPPPDMPLGPNPLLKVDGFSRDKNTHVPEFFDMTDTTKK